MGGGSSKYASTFNDAVDVGAVIPRYDEFQRIPSSTPSGEELLPFHFIPFDDRVSTRVYQKHVESARSELKALCTSVATSDTDGGAADSEVWQRITRLIILLGLERTVLPAGDLSSGEDSSEGGSSSDNEDGAAPQNEEQRIEKSLAKIRFSLEGYSAKKEKKKKTKEKKKSGPNDATDKKEEMASTHVSSKQSRGSTNSSRATAATPSSHRGTVILLLDCARIAVLRSQAQDGNAWECLGSTLWYIERRRQVNELIAGAASAAAAAALDANNASRQQHSPPPAAVRCQIYEDVVGASECFEKAWMERGVESAEDSIVHLEAMRLLNAVSGAGSGTTAQVAKTLRANVSGAGAGSHVFALLWKSQLEEVMAKVVESLSKRRNNAALWFVLSRLLYFLSPPQQHHQRRNRRQLVDTAARSEEGSGAGGAAVQYASGRSSRASSAEGLRSATARASASPSPLSVADALPPFTATVRNELFKDHPEVVDWIESLGNAIECDPRDFVLWFRLIVNQWPVIGFPSGGSSPTHNNVQWQELFGKHHHDSSDLFFSDGSSLPVISIGAERAIPLNVAVARALRQHHLHRSNPSLEYSEFSRIRGFIAPHQFQNMHVSLLAALAALAERTIRTNSVGLEATVVSYRELLLLSIKTPSEVADLPPNAMSTKQQNDQEAAMGKYIEQLFHTSVVLEKDVDHVQHVQLLSTATMDEPCDVWLRGDMDTIVEMLRHFPRRPLLWRYLATLLANQDAPRYKRYWGGVAESLGKARATEEVTQEEKREENDQRQNVETSKSKRFMVGGRRVQFSALSDQPSNEQGLQLEASAVASIPKQFSNHRQRSKLTLNAAVKPDDQQHEHHQALVQNGSAKPQSNDDTANGDGGAVRFFWTPITVIVTLPVDDDDRDVTSPLALRKVSVSATDCLLTSLSLNPADPLGWYSLAQQLRRYDVPMPNERSAPPVRTVTSEHFGILNEGTCLIKALSLLLAREDHEEMSTPTRPVESPEEVGLTAEGDSPQVTRAETSQERAHLHDKDATTHLDASAAKVKKVFTTLMLAIAFRLTQLFPLPLSSPISSSVLPSATIPTDAQDHVGWYRIWCQTISKRLTSPSESFMRAYFNTKVFQCFVREFKVGIIKEEKTTQNWHKNVRTLIQTIASDLFPQSSSSTPTIMWSSSVAFVVALLFQCFESLQSALASQAEANTQPHSLNLNRALLSDVVQEFVRKSVDAASSVAAGKSLSASALILQSHLSHALPAMDALLGQFARGEGRDRSTWWTTFFENYKQRWLPGLLQCVAADSTNDEKHATTPSPVVVTAAVLVTGCFFQFVAANNPMNVFSSLLEERGTALWKAYTKFGTKQNADAEVTFESVVSILVRVTTTSAPDSTEKMFLAPYPQLRDITTVVLPTSRVLQQLFSRTLQPFPSVSSDSNIVDQALVLLQASVGVKDSVETPFVGDLAWSLVCASVHIAIQHAPLPQRNTLNQITDLLSLSTPAQPQLQTIWFASGWTVDSLYLVGYMAGRYLNIPLVVDVIRALRTREEPNRNLLPSKTLETFTFQVCALAGEVFSLDACDDNDDRECTSTATSPANLVHWVTIVDAMCKIINQLVLFDEPATPYNNQQRLVTTRETFELRDDFKDELVSLVLFISESSREQSAPLKCLTLSLDVYCVIAWFLALEECHPVSSTSLQVNTLIARIGKTVSALNSRALHHCIAVLRGGCDLREIDTPLYCWSLLSLFEKSGSLVVAISSTEFSAFDFLASVYQTFQVLGAQRFGLSLWKKASAQKLSFCKQPSGRVLEDVWREIVHSMPAEIVKKQEAAALYSPTTRPTITQLLAFIDSYS
ncbi:Hypothetical protein, putative [Bodo saltans]|uniref:Uncharacterized protein n=1 Tax=Bodo saltans TaxID=75058 RepID=A0A0S4JMA1_BODSA|nr:Hypothetical protein, putative [Bodo saltans]|eukprot:CUG91353.1 Hypothetical protein, putative [Bodo saltans]